MKQFVLRKMSTLLVTFALGACAQHAHIPDQTDSAQLTIGSQQLSSTNQTADEWQRHRLEKMRSVFEYQDTLWSSLTDSHLAAGGIEPYQVPVPLRDGVAPATLVEADLWSRFDRQLSWQYPMNRRTEAEKKWFLNNTDYIERVFKRGSPYLYHIVNELESNGMPVELALLPVIESAYQPFAFSHSRASGIWQFIPSTGRLYGLKQNWWYDGRRDIIAATGAAIAFFKYLDEQFDGDWLHALAAYNAGPGRVQRAIKRNKKLGKPTSFWHLDLPRETQNYVPRMLALVDIMQKPSYYGIELPDVENKPVFQKVDIGQQIDLARVASMANMDIEELYRFNPGFNRWATDPDGPHNLLIPVANTERFKSALAVLPESQRITWVRHKIRSGENLGTIARRHKISVSYLKKVNELSSNLIRVGDILMIPSESKSSNILAQHTPRGAGVRHIHQVARGDTLWGLANRYNTSVKQLSRWNNIGTKSPIRPKQKLVVWLPRSKSSQEFSYQVLPNKASIPALKYIHYRVRRGDSLDRIARKFNIKVADLLHWNSGLDKSKYIHPGQKIYLRLDVRNQSG